MGDVLNELDNEYQTLFNKYKNNYEVAEFYPTNASIETSRVGCLPTNALKLQKINDELHTPESCKMAVSLSAANTRPKPASKSPGLKGRIHKKPIDITSTRFNSLSAALGDKMPSKDAPFLILWFGVIMPDVNGSWNISITTNTKANVWFDEYAGERGTYFNSTLKTAESNPSKTVSVGKDAIKDKPIYMLMTVEHSMTNRIPEFSLTIQPPSSSAYSSPEKMYDCLFTYKNDDGSTYKPPNLYYAFVENSPEDTEKNMYQCYYGTSLNSVDAYNNTDNTDGYYHSTDEVQVWSLFEQNNTTDIKPGNRIKIDGTGVHVFNAQGAIVKTLHTLQKDPMVRYVRIEMNKDKPKSLMLNINEIEVFDVDGNKIPADKMSARLGPQYGNGKDFGAQFLVDGVKQSSDKGKYVLPHTTSSPAAFIEVDLIKARPISKVKVYNRNDCCKDRILNGQVVFLGQDKEQICRFPVTQINDVYDFNLSSGGCTTTTSKVNKHIGSTGIKYTLGLLYNSKKIQFALMRMEKNTPVLDTVLAEIKGGKSVPNYKWFLERNNQKFTETSEEVSASRPLISADSRCKLMIDAYGNCIIQESRMGCPNKHGRVSYRKPSNPDDKQYLYAINTDENYNKTYYVNKMSNTMQYLPRNSPMLEHVNEYTAIKNYVPSGEHRATAFVASREECEAKCNDASGCPWYAIYKQDNKNMCVIGKNQPEDIVSADMLSPVPSGVSHASVNIRNKQLRHDEKYMLDKNIPHNRIMNKKDASPYVPYNKGAPISGMTPLGILSEKDVQDYFKKQNHVVNGAEALNGTEGFAGEISKIQNELVEPAIRRGQTYNKSLSDMTDKSANIETTIGKYEQVRDVMTKNEIYKFNTSDFREKPTLADGILEDNKELVYQQNLMYLTTGIAVATLGIAAALVVRSRG